MLEVEVKYLVDDMPALERLAGERFGHPNETRTDADHYFNAPDRDFAQTDEALRVRSIGERNFVTYKGPKRDAQTKTRTELELPLSPGGEAAAAFRQLLGHLKYRASGVVRKSRRVYMADRDGFELQVCLDEVTGLGAFAEIEVTADEDRFEVAKATVLREAVALGLTQPERRSYLEMLLTKAAVAS